MGGRMLKYQVIEIAQRILTSFLILTVHKLYLNTFDILSTALWTVVTSTVLGDTEHKVTFIICVHYGYGSLMLSLLTKGPQLGIYCKFLDQVIQNQIIICAPHKR